MREDNPNWFLRWELPSPEELIPISQTLITPHLALAFQIKTPNHHHQKHDQSDFGGEETTTPRTLKRPRLVWTPQLHKRFVDAVGHLGIKNAVPKTIMQLMNVEGLSRENVASHLQKYRLYLKRMQSGGNGISCGHVVVSDSATDRLFASSHFLNPIRVNSMSPLTQFEHSYLRCEGYNGDDGGTKILKLFPSGN